MGTTPATLTFEEFEGLPDQPGKRELLKGELIESPPAEVQQNRISLRIYLRLHAALTEAHAHGGASELGEASHEMGYRLTNNVWVQPDASVTFASQPEGKYFGGSPAIAIEVVSPGNTVQEMETKTDLYFEFGAREVWRVHPKNRRVVIHLPSEIRIVREHEAITTPLLPGFSLSVSEILGG